jgi:hypothetical protein
MQSYRPCAASGAPPDRRPTRRPGVVLLVLIWGLGVACGSGTTAPSAEEAAPMVTPRPTMRLVFEEMKTLVPLGLDEMRWSDPAMRAKVLASLERLDGLAVALEHHGRSREAGFDELALSLGRDLRAARDHYAAGEYAESRFFLTGSLQSCVSCHVRLPADQEFDLAGELTAQVEIEALDPRERAWLLVMVRRFDEALGDWETLLADPSQAPAELDATGVLVDYLNVAIRVRTDIERARVTLDEFASREDLPVYLRRRVDGWREALADLDAESLAPGRPPSVDRGAELARRGAELAQGPYGRDGLVQDLAAASQLVRFLEADRARTVQLTRNRTPAERREAARAYYWLATVEARSLDGFWINLSERHFEAAIRADPTSGWAQQAYAQLEEIQVLGFGGASGMHLPPDVWTRLRELRELMGLETPAEVPDYPLKDDSDAPPEGAGGQRS